MSRSHGAALSIACRDDRSCDRANGVEFRFEEILVRSFAGGLEISVSVTLLVELSPSAHL